MPSMNISIDVRTAAGNRAGKGNYTYNLLREILMIDRKNQYFLLHNGENPFEQKADNIHPVYISGRGAFWQVKAFFALRRHKINLHFSPSSYIIPAFLPVSTASIVTIHDLISFKEAKNHQKFATIIERLFLARALKKATYVCPVSENTAKDLHSLFPKLHLQISHIPCAASGQFQPISRDKLVNFATQTNTPAKFFLAVGSIIPRKNYLGLIEAFAVVNKQFPEYKLLIIGSKGWQYEELFQRIDELKIKRHVHFLGHIKDSSLVKLYNLATALVFPSFYEGFGIPPLEAMQSGCPVIASEVSSIPEVVGNAALMIDPNHYQNIVGAMLRLITEKDLREKMREKGLIQAQKFSWNASAKKLLAIINEIA